jgi:hypothetical protein
MPRREWILSGLFVAFVAFKVAEGVLAIESWPLSHVPMFAVRQGPESRPWRLAVYARRRGTWFEMQPFQLGLDKDELHRHLLAAADAGAACAELIDAFNTSRPPRRRVDAAYVSLTIVARPGSGARDTEQRTPCPLHGRARR